MSNDPSFQMIQRLQGISLLNDFYDSPHLLNPITRIPAQVVRWYPTSGMKILCQHVSKQNQPNRLHCTHTTIDVFAQIWRKINVKKE